jgi:alkylhydroperoxidase family enzyme
MDTNAVGSSAAGASAEKIDATRDFEKSELFTPAEKAALRLAEGMSRTPAEVSDAVFEAARQHFSEAQLVELAATAAMENYRARFNRAFGVESQGFYKARAARHRPHA